MDSKLQRRIQELIKETIEVVDYDLDWPKLFEQEANNLRTLLPKDIVKRIEHFGSTAVPGLSAKPIIDMLIEVTSLDATKQIIVPLLTQQGYEYFWRPSIGDQPPFYAWFIKRNRAGQRTHHLHMVEADSPLWDRLYFRDYLRQFPKIAKQYNELKKQLSSEFAQDRVGYTQGKTAFIAKITKKAKHYFA